MADPSPPDRRAFFRRLTLRGMNHLDRVGGALGQVLRKLEQSQQQPRPIALSRGVRLRPPGAMPEPSFSQACSSCGKCVEACPARCIFLDDPDPVTRQRLPAIEARVSPCVVCEELACMKACPTGALKLVEKAADIRMGWAEMDFGSCLRGDDGGGEDCRVCVSQCPMGEGALGIDGRGLVEVRPGCVGCGVCERACPTEPASVKVRAWSEAGRG